MIYWWFFGRTFLNIQNWKLVFSQLVFWKNHFNVITNFFSHSFPIFWCLIWQIIGCFWTIEVHKNFKNLFESFLSFFCGSIRNISPNFCDFYQFSTNFHSFGIFQDLLGIFPVYPVNFSPIFGQNQLVSAFHFRKISLHIFQNQFLANFRCSSGVLPVHFRYSRQLSNV